jgi:hypothetical protein
MSVRIVSILDLGTSPQEELRTRPLGFAASIRRERRQLQQALNWRSRHHGDRNRTGPEADQKST